MKIIVCVFVAQLITDALWEHVPISNFSQGTSRVQLGKSQVEIGTQISLRDEQIYDMFFVGNCTVYSTMKCHNDAPLLFIFFETIRASGYFFIER